MYFSRDERHLSQQKRRFAHFGEFVLVVGDDAADLSDVSGTVPRQLRDAICDAGFGSSLSSAQVSRAR